MSTEDPTMDLLAHHAFPRLGAALHARVPSIIQLWQAYVLRTLPAADELTIKELHNSLPMILEEMATALSSPVSGPTRDLIEGGKEHGTDRFHEHFNVRELIVEYRLLRRAILEQLTEELGAPLDISQNIAINMALDTALQSGLVTFTDHQRAKIQSTTEAQAKYLSFLSHDLRNHLNHATLVLQLLGPRLAEIPGCADCVQDVEAIQRSIFQTTDGMDMLLQAERLRKKVVKPKWTTVDLRELFSQLAQHQSPAARAKGLLWETHIPPGAQLKTDPDLVTLVLQNLIGNAIKYSDRGKVVLSAAPASSASQAGWVISVSDEGPGIATEDLNRVFEAFKRGDTHGQAGMGLGLAIASQAAKVLGAQLEVESKLGAGSTFRLILPAPNSDDSPATPAAPTRP